MTEHPHHRDRRARRSPARRGIAWALAGLVALGGGLLTAAPAQAADVPESFTLHGSGYGHGVGMSQYGAYQMAREGASSTRILHHYYAGTSTAYRETPRNIRVQVFGPDPHGRSAYGDSADSTRIRVEGGGWRLRRGDDTIARGGAGDTLRAFVEDGRIRVRVNGKTYRGGPLKLHWSGTRHYRYHGADAVVHVAGAQGIYRHGRLELVARDGVPNIVNHLRINTEYLYGVAEMPSSWGLNGGRLALRAQVIAARSYAIAHLGLEHACRCDVVDDVRDQNFTGWKKESEGSDGRYGRVWKRQVDATEHSSREARVLSYDGEVVEAPYYSSSGGRTADSEDVWRYRVPYLRSEDDPYSLRAPGNSYASWTRTITQAQARKMFGMDAVRAIWVTDRWTSGQVRTLRATSATGRREWYTAKADTMRSTIGDRTKAGWAPSSWITKIRRQW